LTRGRDHFTAEEITWIRAQLAALRRAERDEQKRIRAGLRRVGFRISDWATDGQGFTVSDFDLLVRRGMIKSDATPRDAGPIRRHASSPAPPNRRASPGQATDRWVAAQLDAAIAALTHPRNSLAACLAGAVPDAPGLYAIYGSKATWRQLGLGGPPDDRPLYVGKAEASLVSRDLNTHFRTGRTGHSSPRRSLAALLAEDLQLIAIPRRPHAPEAERWANYALAPAGDARLTDWMRRRLKLAVWSDPAPLALGELETAILGHFAPPLNLNKVAQPWSGQVRRARREMAEGARRWVREHEHDV
jgi:hypothetical protein